MRIFGPLKIDHPLIGLMGGCALCHEGFYAGQRTVLAPAREVLTSYENVPAIPVHATCALRGMKVIPAIHDKNGYKDASPGVIARIVEGDGSPFPVVLEDGRQFKFEEVGLKGE